MTEMPGIKGFKFAGIPAGIKKNGRRDLGLIFCETPATAAALFTRNHVVAAPIIIGKETIKNGKCQAVLVNSGNANCFTGSLGVLDARETARLVAKNFDIPEDLVMVSSTGVIGAPLPMDRFKTGIPQLKEQISFDLLEDFAQAILTTDTCQKIARQNGSIETPQGVKQLDRKSVV